MQFIKSLSTLAILTLGLSLSACGGGGSGGGGDPDPQLQPPALSEASMVGRWASAYANARTSGGILESLAGGGTAVIREGAPWTTLVDENDKGTIEPTRQADTTVAEVSADGGLILRNVNLDPAIQVRGALSTDATVAAVGSTLQGTAPGLQVMTRHGTGMSLASIEGDDAWIAFGVRHSVSTGVVQGYGGIATINQNGTFVNALVASGGNVNAAGLVLDHGISDSGANAPGAALRGGFRPQADFGAFAGRLDPNQSDLLEQVLMVRLTSGVTNATTSGRYRILFFTPGLNSSTYLGGVAELDGATGLTVSFPDVNEEGTLGAPLDETGQYTFLDDGRGAVVIGELVMDAATTQNGDVIALSAATSTSRLPAIGLMIRMP